MLLVLTVILEPTPGPVQFMGLKIYDCFSRACLLFTGLLSLLCDVIMTSHVNNEITFCIQFKQNLVFIQSTRSWRVDLHFTLSVKRTASSVSLFFLKKFNIHIFWNPVPVVQQFKASISQFNFSQRLQNLTPHPLELEGWLVTRQLKLQ